MNIHSDLNNLMSHLVYTSLAPQKIYSSSLSTSSQSYRRDCDKQIYYYESIRVKANQSGYYSFRSYSSIDTYGSIYRKTFNPLTPLENFLQTDDDNNNNLQFRLDVRLSGGAAYVLVITTYPLKGMGAFSIVAFGVNTIVFERLSKYTARRAWDRGIF